MRIRKGRVPALAGLCEWFALCTNKASTTRTHPVLGDVPICDRCNQRIAALHEED